MRRRTRLEQRQTSRDEQIASQAEQLLALADEASLLVVSEQSYREVEERSGLKISTEHLVEFDLANQRAYKATHPNTFGLTPGLCQVSSPSGQSESQLDQFLPSLH